MTAHDVVALIESQESVVRSWRTRLLIVLVLFALGAALATGISLVYGESLLTPALLWAGTGCVYMARRTVPGPVISIDRPATGASAAWVCAAIVFYVAVPVALNQWGYVAG